MFHQRNVWARELEARRARKAEMDEAYAVRYQEEDEGMACEANYHILTPDGEDPNEEADD